MQENRDYLLIYLNGKRLEISGAEAFMTVSDFLRESRQLTGTKVVCAEGDCGACTILVGVVKPKAQADEIQFQAINSCIQFMHGLDCTHLITVEGLNALSSDQLHPVQQAMVKAQATQCGFCTPGFVMAAAGMLESLDDKQVITPQTARNYLTGNLCRCTGYQSIINAMVDIDRTNSQSVKTSHHNQAVHQDLLNHTQIPVNLNHCSHSFSSPIDIQTAVTELTANKAQVFAASTDLGVQYNKGQWHQQNVVSLKLVAATYEVKFKQNHVAISARVTLDELEHQLSEKHPEWSEFMHIFASPQIKNNGTLVGNIANGSPIGDNLPFLLAMDATLLIHGDEEQRTLNINDFYLGFREKDLSADEIITQVNLPYKHEKSFLKLYKVSQRRDLDISCVAAAFYMVFDNNDELTAVAIALGGVAATPVRLTEVETKLIGTAKQVITSTAHVQQTADKMAQAIEPMTDVRGSAEYRSLLVKNLYKKYTAQLAESINTNSEAVS